MEFVKKKVGVLEGLRIIATFLLVLTACLIAFDSQTKLLFGAIHVKASYRALKVLKVLVWINSAAAAYNVVQILGGFIVPIPKYGKNFAWLCYLMDQAIVYAVFATNSAAIQGSIFAITGQKNFQWMKVCDKFTRFCIQMGGAYVCNLAASFVLAVISCMSGCSLFRLYSQKHFLRLKPVQINYSRFHYNSY